MKTLFGLLALLLAAALTAPAHPAEAVGTDSAVVAPAEASRSVRLGQQTIHYRVSWSSLMLRDAAGQPAATISATSYVRERIADPVARPVLFAFNGGPGASSTPLHFGLLGPRRAVSSGEKGVKIMVDNQESVIDVADLVLVDPVGTGLSRELHPGGGARFWTVAGDAAAVEQLIRQWLTTHHRETSPVCIVGESFGGFRAAVLAKTIGDLNLQGVVLISPGLDFTSVTDGKDLLHVFELPAMALAAVAHGKVDAKGRSAHIVYDEAAHFAQWELLPALSQGAELDPALRDRLAERMSALIGISAKVIGDANLRLDAQDFLERLVPGYVVGRLDTRIKAPKPESALIPGRDKAADDPALRMGAYNVKKSDSALVYLRDEVGVRTDLDYISLTLDVNFKWDWNSGSPKMEDNVGLNPTGNLTELLKKRPGARLLMMSGLYDLATPANYQRYTIMHAGIPLERIELQVLPEGHTVYDSDEGRRLAAAQLRRFLQHGSTSPSP